MAACVGSSLHHGVKYTRERSWIALHSRAARRSARAADPGDPALSSAAGPPGAVAPPTQHRPPSYFGARTFANSRSRFRRAMKLTLISFGQDASHSPWFVQWPKPSASIVATIDSARLSRSA